MRGKALPGRAKSDNALGRAFVKKFLYVENLPRFMALSQAENKLLCCYEAEMGYLASPTTGVLINGYLSKGD